MATISTTYTGNLRTKSIHLGSGMELITDAPKDNKGLGEAFSPSDLLATSLGTCMLTIMGITAREHGMAIEGTTVEITKIMGQDPRRVAEVNIEFNVMGTLNEKERTILERAAHTCPVARSVHPDMVQGVVFNYVQ